MSLHFDGFKLIGAFSDNHCIFYPKSTGHKVKITLKTMTKEESNI